MPKRLPSIQRANRDYEDWLRARLPRVDTKGLDKKHEKMAAGEFEFLRATF
jgi:hypothetical protein